MWEKGQHIPRIKRLSSLETLSDVKGTLDLEKAQMWFADYCYSNPHFTVKLLTGVDLYPVQDILIRSFFLRDFNLFVAGRGFSKSFTISIFIILFALFNPGVRVIICSGTFRQSKLIFKQIERFLDDDKGLFLRQCITKNPSHSTDSYEVGLNHSTITAVPLTEKIRGLRANLVVIDELFLVPTEIMNLVIKPFLNVKYKGKEQQELKLAEDILIKSKKMSEDDRTIPLNNKLIGLSSASFQVEALYKDYYLPYVQGINDSEAKGINHFVARLSYEAAPPTLLDMGQIEDAKRTSSTQEFDREYRALFLPESGGYFSMQNILDASIKQGDHPTVKLSGEPDKKYILAIDPNYSDSEIADDFAMCLIELDEPNRAGYVVHAYAVSKSSISKRAQYLAYLLESFNIVFVIVDNAGGPKFIDDCKQFMSLPKDLTMIQGDFMGDKGDLRDAVNSYNYLTGRILYSQVFSKNGWIRLANDTLKSFIEYKKLLFASRIYEIKDLEVAKNANVPIDLEYKKDQDKLEGDGSFRDEMLKNDFASHIFEMVELTKLQLSSIEISTTEMGVQRFDLPRSQKSNRSVNRARKDSYVALLMASWGMKCYYDIVSEENSFTTMFKPMRIR